MDVRSRRAHPGYQFFMLGLCLYALATLTASTVLQLSPESQAILRIADDAVCAVFLADFVLSLVSAPNRWRYLYTWGWLDLLSSIPMIEVARWARLARIARLLRVLRGLRATQRLAASVLNRRAENTFLAVSLVAFLLVIFCSVAVLHFETLPESNIETPEESLWWALATVTTVGYGDRYPVTSEGRLIAVILMAAGVGLFGTFSGFLAAWFLGPKTDASGHDERTAIHAEIVLLRRSVQALESRLAPAPSTPGASRDGETT